MNSRLLSQRTPEEVYAAWRALDEGARLSRQDFAAAIRRVIGSAGGRSDWETRLLELIEGGDDL